MAITSKTLHKIMYHAKDTDKSAVYTCHECMKKNFSAYKNMNVFTQNGCPVTIPYVCSECKKEKRCFRFAVANK